MHLGDITYDAYMAFTETFEKRGEILTCPSNPKPPVFVGAGTSNARWQTTIRYMGGWDCSIGSFFQAPGGDFWPGGDLPYYSPVKLSSAGGTGGKIIFADGIYRLPFYGLTYANHGYDGYTVVEADTHPAEIPGLEGGNVGYLDGSAKFKKANETPCDPLEIPGYMQWFQANGGGATVTSLPGQGWNRTHNASYGQWYF